MKTLRWLAENWSRVLFLTLAFGLIALGVRFLLLEKEALAAIPMAFGFLALILAFLSKFKRFKGFGLEAEMWEDKQLEAEAIINKFKSLLSIQSRAIIHARIQNGRFASKNQWAEIFDLLSDLEATSSDFGVDLRDAKALIADYFLRDFAYAVYEAIRKEYYPNFQRVSTVLESRFGKVISDHDGYNEAIRKKSEIEHSLEFEFGDRNCAQKIEEFADSYERKIKLYFDINFQFSRDARVELEFLREVERSDFPLNKKNIEKLAAFND